MVHLETKTVLSCPKLRPILEVSDLDFSCWQGKNRGYIRSDYPDVTNLKEVIISSNFRWQKLAIVSVLAKGDPESV